MDKTAESDESFIGNETQGCPLSGKEAARGGESDLEGVKVKPCET